MRQIVLATWSSLSQLSFQLEISEAGHYPAEDQSIRFSLLTPGMCLGFPPFLYVVSLQETSATVLLPKLFVMFSEMSKWGFWIHLKHVRVVCVPQPSLCRVLLCCWEKNLCQSRAHDPFGLLQNPSMARCSWCSAWTTAARPPPSTWSFVRRN